MGTPAHRLFRSASVRGRRRWWERQGRVEPPAAKGVHQATTEGGTTHDPRAGATFQPDTGYAVGSTDKPVAGPASHRSAFIRAERRFLTQYESGYMGTWRDPEGNLWLDPTDHIADRAEAERLGRERGQYSIWDFANQREIVL